MKFQFKRISSKVMAIFAVAMVVTGLGIFLYNNSSLRSFGYDKELERARGLTNFCEEIRTFIGVLNEEPDTLSNESISSVFSTSCFDFCTYISAKRSTYMRVSYVQNSLPCEYTWSFGCICLTRER